MYRILQTKGWPDRSCKKNATEMLVAGQVSFARYYNKLMACFFGKRYRSSIASPTFSVDVCLR